MVEDDIVKTEQRINDAKQKLAEGEAARGQTDSLHRKIQMLETIYNKVAAQLKEADEKVKVLEKKANTYQEKAAQLEQEKENYEQLNEEINTKYVAVKKELDDTLKSLEDM